MRADVEGRRNSALSSPLTLTPTAASSPLIHRASVQSTMQHAFCILVFVAAHDCAVSPFQPLIVT